MAQVKKCNSKHRCSHVKSLSQNAISSGEHSSGLRKHPYDHETRDVTLDILMSTAGEVIVQNIIFDLVITYKFFSIDLTQSPATVKWVPVRWRVSDHQILTMVCDAQFSFG